MHNRRHARAVARALAPAPQFRRSCGKRFYADRISADLSLAAIRARGPALSKDPVRSYPCPRCNGWHLTSVPTWQSARAPIPHPRTASVRAARSLVPGR